MGVNNDYLEARDWPLRSGRPFDTAELAGSAKVVWLGATVARELFGDQDPVEQTVRLRGIPMTVVGVLSPKGQNSMGQDQDDVVMLPLGTLRNRVWGGDATSRLKRVGSISVKVREGQDMGAVEERIKELLRQRFKVQPGAEDPFSVRNLTEMLRAQEESSRVMTLLLATVAGISLVIGGIGIMNIMLVSVTERTREIGLRMAVGARGRDILAQFLIEAITLSLVGGALGVVLGAGATWLIGALADWQVSLSLGAVLLEGTVGAAIDANVFERLDGVKERFGLASATLSQTTLEQVFNTFAGKQEEERGVARGDGDGDTVDVAELESVALMLPLSVEEAVSERVAAGERVPLMLPLALVLSLPLPLRLTVWEGEALALTVALAEPLGDSL
jgi:hypothetical protein